MNLLDVVQTIVQKCLAASQLTDMVTGTVTAVDPLEIQVDTTQATLTEAVLILTNAVTNVAAIQEGSVLDLEDTGLALGDKVILLRVLHGQKFIVLSRAY